MGSVLGLGKVGLGLVWVWPGLAWIVGHGGVDSDCGSGWRGVVGEGLGLGWVRVEVGFVMVWVRYTENVSTPDSDKECIVSYFRVRSMFSGAGSQESV